MIALDGLQLQFAKVCMLEWCMCHASVASTVASTVVCLLLLMLSLYVSLSVPLFFFEKKKRLKVKFLSGRF